MAKSRVVISLVAMASIALSACGQSGASPSGGSTPDTGPTTTQTAATPTPSAMTQTAATPTPSAMSQTNPDGTVTDADGFVRFPGEPTRPDQAHYYVVEDICGQFTKPFMEGLSGKTFKKIVPITSTTTDACDYYTATTAADGKDAYLLVVLNYLNVDHQKAAQVTLGRTITTNSGIPMDHWVATQDNGVINAIYFVLGTDKFMRLDRSSTSVLSDTELVALAVKLGTKMKDFK